MRCCLSVLVLICVAGLPVRAQTAMGGGSIAGTVKDAQGAVVPGAVIKVTSPTVVAIPHEATSDASGQYRLTELPPGEYRLTAALSGFATTEQAVRVQAGLSVTVNLTMSIGAIDETLIVRAESPLLETRSGAQAVNVSGELLRQVPLSEGREWFAALAVAPGVVTSEFAGGKQFFIRGSDSSSTVIQLDGADVTSSAKAGVTYLTLNTDAIDDIQIQTGGVRASSPLGTGGIINIVTASGTNRVKGAGTLFLQPRAWNDSNQPGGTSTSVEQTHIDLSLGGPIVKDRWWGFGSYRRSDVTTGISRTAAELAVLETLIPGFEPIDATNEANFWLGKLTAQTGVHHISAFYQKDTNPTFDVSSTGQHPFGQATGGLAASGRVSSAWSNRVTTTLAASYNDKRRESVATAIEGPVVRLYDSAILSGGRLAGNGLLATLGAPVVSRLTQPNDKLTVAFDTTLYGSHGSMTHELQAGLYAETRVQGNHVDYINDGFTMEEAVLRQPGVVGSGYVPFHRLVMNGPELTLLEQRSRDIAVYVQDAWRPSSRLTVSGGVRIDRIIAEDEVFGITAQRSVDVGPRAGVNYAVTADARNVARAHWARVHDQPGVVTTTGNVSVGQRDLYDLNLDGTFETVFVTPPNSAALANRSIDADLHQPYVDEWGAGFSRQLKGSIAANIDVARRRFMHRPTLVETNGRYSGRVFTGYADESFNEIYLATNNRWNTPVYTSLELSATKRTARVQALASYVRQWRHIDGTWQPNDPASFIQPDAFPNGTGIGSSTGTAAAPTDANSLSGTHMTQRSTASSQWQDHVARVALAVSAPWALVVSGNYTYQSGAWSGPIVTRVAAADPAFGPSTVTLSNGRVVSNPLATVTRFAFQTRGDGQFRSPHMHALNLRVGRRFAARRVTFDTSLDMFNLTNNGADLGFQSGANQTYNPLFGLTTDRQAPRSAQFVVRVAF